MSNVINSGGFFGLTSEDLSNGKATFAAGDEATMSITSIVKKDINGNETIIVENVVMTGANTGLKHGMFFRLTSDGGRAVLGTFLTTFMTAQQVATMTDPSVLINRKFSCKFVDNKGYINEKNFKEVSDVPVMATAQGVPAQQVIQPPTQQPVLQQQQPTPLQQQVNQTIAAQPADIALGKSLF